MRRDLGSKKESMVNKVLARARTIVFCDKEFGIDAICAMARKEAQNPSPALSKLPILQYLTKSTLIGIFLNECKSTR